MPSSAAGAAATVLVCYDSFHLRVHVARSRCASLSTSQSRPSQALLLGLASVFMDSRVPDALHRHCRLRTSVYVFYDPLIYLAPPRVAIIASSRGSLSSEPDEPNQSEASSRKRRSLLLGLASSMHYTGMAAARFTSPRFGWRPNDELVLGTYQLGLVVAIASIVLLVMALAANRFERWTNTTRNRFENLLELSPQVVWFGQPDGRITYCNPYWYQYTGFPERTTLGFGWTPRPSEDRTTSSALASAVQRGGTSSPSCDYPKRHYFCFSAGAPRWDASGNVEAWPASR